MSVVHGHRWPVRSPTYNTWRAMISRCCYEQHPFYADYGGRGIRVCDRWRSFAAFLADMGERPPGMTLDREEVDGDYEPGNCRWATLHEQRWNRRDMAARLQLVAEDPDYWQPAARTATREGIPF